MVRRHGLQLVGMHMHIGSGVDYGHLEQVCDAMVRTVLALGHDIEAISAGGGLSVPYQDHEPRVDTAHYFPSGTPPAGASPRPWATRCAWRSSRAGSWWPKPASCYPRCGR